MKDKEHSVSSVDDYGVSLDAIRLGTIALEPSVSQRAFLRETLDARRAIGDAEGTAIDLQGAPPAQPDGTQWSSTQFAIWPGSSNCSPMQVRGSASRSARVMIGVSLVATPLV